MALIKSVTDTTGATFSYWRIAEVRGDVASRRGIVTVRGWLDQAARNANMAPCLTDFGFDIQFTNDPLPAPLTADTGNALYDALLTGLYLAIMAQVAADTTHPLNGAVAG